MHIEFRFVFDCESMSKVLQYRYMSDGMLTDWISVPTVLGVITDGKVVSIDDSKK